MRAGSQAAPVEQVRIRRSAVGLRAYDPDRSFNGYTLFTPQSTVDHTVYLIDMQGTGVHTWEMPCAPGLYGYPTPTGTLFYNRLIPPPHHPSPTAHAWPA